MNTPLVPWIPLAMIALASCGPGEIVEITGRRIVSADSRPVQPGVSTATRFGASSAPAPVESPFRWNLPEGWIDLGASGLRVANLQPAGNPDAECTLTLLGGTGGGMEANINRWRSQMGLDPMGEGEVDELPRMGLLGAEAVRVEFDGAYAGMGTEARPDWSLLGAIMVTERVTIFVKMTAPLEVMAAERSNFDAFCASVTIEMAGTDAHGASSASAAAPKSNPTHSYDLPEGWSELPPAGMRSVNLRVGKETQCFLIELAGEAGGLLANVNRWCNEMGEQVFDDTALESLERVPCLGGEGVLLELTGDYQGAVGKGSTDSGLLGMLLVRDSGSVFVKMVGPREEVQAAQSEFIAFVQSLKKL